MQSLFLRPPSRVSSGLPSGRLASRTAGTISMPWAQRVWSCWWPLFKRRMPDCMSSECRQLRSARAVVPIGTARDEMELHLGVEMGTLRRPAKSRQIQISRDRHTGASRSRWIPSASPSCKFVQSDLMSSRQPRQGHVLPRTGSIRNRPRVGTDPLLLNLGRLSWSSHVTTVEDFSPCADPLTS